MPDKIITIADLTTGDKAKIIGFKKNLPEYCNKLLAMGLTVGSEFELIRIAPLGDPMEIKIRGFSLILRKQEAAILKLVKIT